MAFRVNILYYRVEILLSNLKRRRGGKSSSNGNLANSSNSARARREAAAMTSSVEYIDDRSIASNRHKNSGVFDQDQRQDSSLERANMKDGGRLAHGDEMDWFNPNVDIIADPVALDPNSNDEDSDGDGAGSVDDDERYGEDLNVNAYILPPTMLDSGLMDSNISGHSLNTPEGGFNGGDSRPSKGKQKLVSLFPGLTVSSGTPKNQHNRTASTGAPSLNRSTNPVPQHYMHHQKKGSNGSNIIFLPPPLLPVPQQQQNQNDSTGNSFSSYNNSMDRPAANSSAGNTRRQQRQPQHLRGPSNVSSKLGVSTTLSTGGNSLQANNNNNSSNRDLRDDDVEYPSELPPSELDYSFD